MHILVALGRNFCKPPPASQQTLGVALTWAIAATIVRPAEMALSISGDDGFSLTGMELETAVRFQYHLVHMIWIDGIYNMVAVQEEQEYGSPSGTTFGPIDPVRYAESFGVHGFKIQSPDQIQGVLKQAFFTPGRVLIEVHVDYRDNHRLFELVNERSIH
jgi:acetolactate synthase-1/2/3 large subunit